MILRTSKTHWKDNKPQLIRITAQKKKTKQEIKHKTMHETSYCPYECLKKYVNIRGKSKSLLEPFFVFKDNSPVLPNHLRVVLRSSLKEAGFQANAYVFHGIRMGRASDLLQMGVSVETIKNLGRWKSNAVYNYLC